MSGLFVGRLLGSSLYPEGISCLVFFANACFLAFLARGYSGHLFIAVIYDGLGKRVCSLEQLMALEGRVAEELGGLLDLADGLLAVLDVLAVLFDVVLESLADQQVLVRDGALAVARESSLGACAIQSHFEPHF